MTELILEPTSTAQWHALVSEAEAACECRLDEALESYLVFLLMRFVDERDIAARALGLDYLRGLRAAGRVRREQLRDVGDHCLLYTGLFPRRAERRMVRLGYFIHIGRSAYDALAHTLQRTSADMYAQLSEAFVDLMYVLQAMRAMGGKEVLQPLQAVELWEDTGSARALARLREHTDALPVPQPSKRKH